MQYHNNEKILTRQDVCTKMTPIVMVYILQTFLDSIRLYIEMRRVNRDDKRV